MKSGSSRVPGVSARVCGLAATLAAACTASHGPESADTATSWLRACVEDHDCTGSSRCVEHLCTIACATNRTSCAAMAAQARCETPLGASQSLCDLACDSDQACAPLGSDYACQQGHCRPGSALELASQPLTLMDPAPDDDASPGLPLVTWTGDRFRVGITGGFPASVLDVFELFPDGKFISRGLPATKGPLPADPVFVSTYAWAINRAGTIAVHAWTQTEPVPDGKPFSLFQFLLPDGREWRTLECDGASEVVPAQQGNDWLVLCHDDDGTARLGRYDPTSERWSSPPQVIEVFPPTARLSLSVQGEDAILWTSLHEPGWVARIPNAAAGDLQPTDQPRVWHALQPDSPLLTEPAKIDKALNGDWLVPTLLDEQPGPDHAHEPDGHVSMQSVVGVHLQGDGAPSESVRFPLSFADQTSVHAVLGLPERGQVAFCFQDISLNAKKHQQRQLFLSLFDGRGNRVGGPHLLTGASTDNGECRLAWSGSQLLATWLDYKVPDAPNTVHARLLSVR